mmetsp:Transcript_49830/g.91989  ORF Transcript_49830/g.91989 Transcript_49830/m.91989 type:complete len:198 (-) Transcript_49830:43-636(-)
MYTASGSFAGQADRPLPTEVLLVIRQPGCAMNPHAMLEHVAYAHQHAVKLFYNCIRSIESRPLLSTDSSPAVKKHLSHVRTALLNPMSGWAMRCVEHPSQTTLPHAKQWCRASICCGSLLRTKAQLKSDPQHAHTARSSKDSHFGTFACWMQACRSASEYCAALWSSTMSSAGVRRVKASCSQELMAALAKPFSLYR